SDVFRAAKSQPSSNALDNQPDQGKLLGFDFYRDPLNAKKPMQTFEEIMKEDKAAKPKIMEDQRKLLESRYDLTPRFHPEAKMSRGKPIPVGPTARLRNGVTWDTLAAMSPEEIREKGLFPYPA